MTGRPRVLLSMNERSFQQLFDSESLARLKDIADLADPLWTTTLDTTEIIPVLQDVDVLLTGWGTTILSAEVLATAPSLRAVFHGAGSVRSFVTEACWERNLVITTAAEANGVPVAEFTLASIIYAGKKVSTFAHRFRAARGANQWKRDIPGTTNYQRVIGLVGLSRIGRRVADLLRPFDFDVLATDPYATKEQAEELGVTLVELDELLERSHVVSLHAPSLPQTKHMLDTRRLALMQDGATLVNTARGALVDTNALTPELVSGRLNAILDVTDPEPLPPDSPLYDLPNVQLTPHVAGSMDTEIKRMGDLAIDELERYITGQPLQFQVRREDMDRVA